MTLLTTHFTLEEFVLSEYAQRKDLDNTPSPGIAANLLITAGGMEKVRAILGNRPIHITSGYRSPLVNSGLGGVPTSYCVGYAADFICPTFSPYVVACAMRDVPETRFQRSAYSRIFWDSRHAFCASHARRIAYQEKR